MKRVGEGRLPGLAEWMRARGNAGHPVSAATEWGLDVAEPSVLHVGLAPVFVEPRPEGPVHALLKVADQFPQLFKRSKFRGLLEDFACEDDADPVVESMLAQWKQEPAGTSKLAALRTVLRKWCLSQPPENALSCGIEILLPPGMALLDREALARHLLGAVDPSGAGADGRFQRDVLFASALALHGNGRTALMEEFVDRFLVEGGRMATLLAGLHTVHDPQSLRFQVGLVGLTQASDADRSEVALLPCAMGHLLCRLLTSNDPQEMPDEWLMLMMAALTKLIPAGSSPSCLMVRTWTCTFRGDKDACRKFLLALLGCGEALIRRRELITSCMAILISGGADLKEVLTPLGLPHDDPSFALWIDACGLQFQRSFRYAGADEAGAWIPRQFATVVDEYRRSPLPLDRRSRSDAAMARLSEWLRWARRAETTSDTGRQVLAECARHWESIEIGLDRPRQPSRLRPHPLDPV